ncbi:STM4015 family protein [Actinoplanes friuliensis]|uniref:Cytoplasmic protein n=1 Tax=Actinoplanes friuliensis DSM 7358 TaxID=1246995 RepID=U5VPY2_9ACTN|nr:STM4015 family protein [Actinoplanes friuliensis]AGZ39013.1 hypothetical protein AFR_03620 [Actinoplanes friuliensis DSM 7358]
MSFYEHATEFAGRRVVDVPLDGPLPPVDGPVAWRFSFWEFDETTTRGLNEKFREAFEAFVERSGGEIEALVIGAWGYAAFDEAPIAQLCEAASRLPRLRALFLGDQTSEECEVSWMRVGDVTPLLAAYPELEILKVRGGSELLTFDQVRHESLRELVFESGGLPSGVVREVLASEFPALTSLELWLGVDEYGGDTHVELLAPLLAGELFPALRHLGLRNSEIVDDIAVALAAAPIVPRLEVLDLSLGTMTDAGAGALLAGQSLSHLRRLDLHHHYLSPEMSARVVAALPGVLVDVSDVQEADEDDDEVYRYTAVGE